MLIIYWSLMVHRDNSNKFYNYCLPETLSMKIQTVFSWENILKLSIQQVNGSKTAKMCKLIMS